MPSQSNQNPEEIDLHSGTGNTVGGGDPNAPHDTTNINHIDVKVGKAVGITPNMNNDDILDYIINTPSDQFLPWEECHLPSRGIYYGWSDGIIKVRPMGQVAEKILTTQRFAQSGQAIDHLFRECCQFPHGFDSTDLLLGDRIFILYYIRGITFGNIYEFVVTCPREDCGAVSTQVYDLNQLAETIVWADSSLGQEPFRIKLPYMSEVIGKDFYVGVRFLRAFDSNAILANRKALKKAFVRPGSSRNNNQQRQMMSNEQLDNTLTENLEKIIVEAQGVSDPFKIRQLIPKLHSQDSSVIREWLKQHTPSIDNTITVTCPECNNDFTVELPITDGFFRKANPRTVRKRLEPNNGATVPTKEVR